MRLVGYTAEVTGLSPNVTEKELHEFFSCCGKIEKLEIFRYGDQICTAYVTFRGAHAVETAELLSGASIGNRCIFISRVETSVDESIPRTSMDEFIPEDDYLSKSDAASSSNASQMHRSVSSPGEAGIEVQHVVTSLMAKGKEAFLMAKALDESYQVSSTAATKVGELSDKLGLTSKIKSGVEVARSIDNKYHVSNTAMMAASATGRKAVEAANAVVNSSYFSAGALCVAGMLDRASKAAANLGQRGAPK